jgi:fructose-1,6-bisphosphatase I
VQESDFLQAGTQQVAAGYCVYGPQTTLVLTVETAWLCSPWTANKALRADPGKRAHPGGHQRFAINMSNMRHWDTP